MTSKLEFQIVGQGYDESVCLVLPRIGTIFNGNCDNLVTSQYGEIELKLNFNYSGFIFHHALRRIDEFIVLLPTLHEANVPQFLSKYLPGTLIFPFDEIKRLWVKLRYNSSELNDLLALNNSDWLLLWLLNIPSLPNTMSIDQIISWLDSRILAEEPQGSPEIREMLDGITSGKIKFSKSLKLYQAAPKPVIVYIDTDDQGIFEWYALNSLDRNEIFLGNNWCINVN